MTGTESATGAGVGAETGIGTGTGTGFGTGTGTGIGTGAGIGAGVGAGVGAGTGAGTGAGPGAATGAAVVFAAWGTSGTVTPAGAFVTELDNTCDRILIKYALMFVLSVKCELRAEQHYSSVS